MRGRGLRVEWLGRGRGLHCGLRVGGSMALRLQAPRTGAMRRRVDGALLGVFGRGRDRRGNWRRWSGRHLRLQCDHIVDP